MKTIELTYHLKDIDAIAASVLEHFESKTILFNGDMGSGKTTFINALLRAMHSEDVATSPTFSIVNEYNIPGDKVYHFDFYRIESIDEAYNFGIEDYLESNNWLFIEWPDRIDELIDEAQSLDITKISDDIRSLKLTIESKLLTENKAMTEPKF
ncbi:tRNA (adenosine(37)-N6)-threonylcarbamoyltransferase complex ATPase subunit type 1 TsaE [Winogradskyella pulchriflava]|uniref:tRNA threonylcarbamoyladenosine biosynthesis protein TsaE n=1 Tax=Winogradskyella pulchriflava TaxID=1110688 RepID=A0ABV6QBF8_9FLAO